MKREKEIMVLNHNEMQLLNKQAKRDQDRANDINAYQDLKKHLETDDARRQNEKLERQEKIKKLLNRQPTVTVD